MFNLDFRLFNTIYNQCQSLGQALGCGALEGFVMYSSVIMLAVVKVKGINSKKVK